MITSPEHPREHDPELEELLGHALEAATHRQFWMIFVDPEGRIVGPLMPMDDHPVDPEEPCETLDLGSAPFAEVIVHRAEMVRRMVGDASVVFVWERLGTSRASRNDLAWVRAIHREAGRSGLPLRAQFLLHGSGIRQFVGSEAAEVDHG